MSDLSDAVETMMAALADAMDVWKRIGERINTLQDRIGRIESRLAALDLRVQAVENRPAGDLAESVHPSVPEMLKGVAKRLTALEDTVKTLDTCRCRTQ
ncbi:MAG: hypothetical protein PHS60_01875 [Zavarzinia sp.]|nr:hypothetical protein [Zavarzinia sp.]